MGRFLNELKAEPIGQTSRGRALYVLTAPLQYELGPQGSGLIVEATAGTITDLASVPRVFWWWVKPDGSHERAAVIHDIMCDPANGWTRAEADGLFLGALEELSEPWLKRYTMYWAVRFGSLWKIRRADRAKHINLMALNKVRDSGLI